MSEPKQLKICRKCRKPQQNELHVLCETCREPYIALDEGLRLLTEDEIAELSSAILKDWRIRFIRWVLPIAALGGVFLAALFLNWQAGKRLRAATELIEQTASNEVNRAYAVATNQLAYQFQVFSQNASNQIGVAYSLVTDQITEEFQASRIRQTVETVAKGEAKTILESNVQPVVAAFRMDVDGKLAAIDETVKKGNATVIELQSYIVFNKTAAAAQNDDRRAFDQLNAWAEDKNYPFMTEAKQTWITILDSHNSPMMMGNFNIPWSEGIDPTKLSFEQLKATYKEEPPQLRVAMVEYIWTKRIDIPKRDRMQFLVDVLRNDSSLRVVEYAGLYFTGASQDKLKRLAIKQHIEWWEKNKESIKD